MERILAYAGEIPPVEDILNTNVNMVEGLGLLAQDVLGPSTCVAGLSCNPSGGLTVLIGAGRIYSLLPIDTAAYSTLSANSNLIVKQGILRVAQTLTFTAPGTAGQSINYLVEAQYLDVDTNAAIMPFYNQANPASPFAGAANNGLTLPAKRAGTVNLTIKAGTGATTGTQTTPAADSGYTGLYVVTVAYGQTTIVNGNIALAAGAPFITFNLLSALTQTTGDVRYLQKYPPLATETGLTIVNQSFPYGHIQRYGALVDGTTDDSGAVGHAITACNAGNYTLTGPPSGVCIISSALPNLSSFGGVDFNVGSMKIQPNGSGYTAFSMSGAPKVINLHIEGTGNAVNGVYLNTVIRVGASNIRTYNLAGQGLQIASCFDCQFNTISVELCGTASLYAFSMTDGGNECDESWFGRIQVERSAARAMYISPNTLNCGFGVIHSEQTNGDGTNPTHILGGSYCTYSTIRVEANSNVITEFNGIGCFVGGFKGSGTKVWLSSGYVSSFAPNELHQFLCDEIDFLGSNVGAWKIVASAITTVSAVFALIGQAKFEDCRLVNISVANSGTIVDLFNCSVTGTLTNPSGNSIMYARQCVLTNFPVYAQVVLRECTVTNAYTTSFGQQINATNCTFSGTITIGNSSVKWTSDGCNFANGITLGTGAPGWSFGPRDFVSGGSVSSGFNASPLGGTFYTGEKTWTLPPTVGQPTYRVWTGSAWVSGASL